MAIVATAPNHFKYMLMTKKINLDSTNGGDVLKAILMNTTFAFNKDNHATLADVTADQLPTGNGYTQNAYVLSGVVVTEDDTNDKGLFSCSDPSWTAVTGNIGPFGAMIIYDDTTADDTIVTCIDFGTDYTIVPGASFTAQTIKLSLN